MKFTDHQMLCFIKSTFVSFFPHNKMQIVFELGKTKAICTGVYPLDSDLDRWYDVVTCKRRNKSRLQQLQNDSILQRYYHQ